MKVDDTSFDAAPDVVLKSLVQLSHMGRLAVQGSQILARNQPGYNMPEDSSLFDEWQQPNEVLVLAYMEKDRINVSIQIHFRIVVEDLAKMLPVS